MTGNEAISKIKWRIKTASEIVGRGEDEKEFEDLEMAIEALKEVEEYKAIGSIEALKRAKKMSEEYFLLCMELKQKIQEYETYYPEKQSPSNELTNSRNSSDDIIPYGTKIIYHGPDSWRNCKCFCGYYNEDDDTYNIYNGWDVSHVSKNNIEVVDW